MGLFDKFKKKENNNWENAYKWSVEIIKNCKFVVYWK